MNNNIGKDTVGIPLFDPSKEEGQWALVDAKDAPRLAAMGRWRVGPYGYARLSVGTQGSDTNPRRRILMHRVIMGVEDSQTPLIDHINRNPLDNRKINLRFATHTENAQNRKTMGRVPYIGVTRNGKGFLARIVVNKVRLCLGTYATPEEAAAAYNHAALQAYGPNARVNQI